jgi:DNA-binding NarL/FixJ family response regulator
MKEFSYKLYKGNIFKELVKTLFEESEYDAMPYGYETQFSSLKRTLSTQSSETALRIRCSPDLLIYDPAEGDVRLVEVKMSRGETIRIDKIEDYQKYWKDALIVVVLNFGNVFYAEEIRKLGIRGYYSPRSDFRPIQELFPNIDEEHLEEYRIIARKMIKATESRQDSEELNDTKQRIKQ